VLKESLKGKAPVGPLVQLCKTIDQAKCVMTMVDSISEKNSKATVSITAARGRVKIKMANKFYFRVNLQLLD
jgi:N-acetyltransferase 10